MSWKQNVLATMAAVLIGTTVADAADKGGISKCQDATGRWHYGDTAAAECARSKVTVLSEQGVKKKEIAAPLSQADLKQRDELKQKEEQAKEQAKQDELLLSSYAHEADVVYVRDRKLSQLESSIKASEETLKSLRGALARMEAQAADEQKTGKVSEQTAKGVEQTRSQVAKHEAAIAMKRKEQEVVRTRAEIDLARYRELKKAPIQAAPKKP